jgi:alanine racemase
MQPEPILRPTTARIDLSAISANLAAITAVVAPASVMPILKANAYGHGLIPIAQHLERQGVGQVGVAYLEEAVELRRAGLDLDILVMGGLVGNQIPHFIDHRLSITASSVDKLAAIDETAAQMGKRASVHLKIDTGMGRIGMKHTSAHRLFEATLAAGHTDVDGVYSHFARSDEADLGWTRTQLDRFNEALDFFPSHGLAMPPRHISNSGGILQVPEANFEMVRPGILLYGVYPSAEVPKTIPVRPALTWTSKVVYFKVLEPGQPVSYGSTWEPNQPTRIITIPVGYGDGYFRRLSNRGEIAIEGRRHPIVGNVCMDQFMVDIGGHSAYNGDQVELIGPTIGVEDVAEWAETIPYEVLTNINTRVPRVYENA